MVDQVLHYQTIYKSVLTCKTTQTCTNSEHVNSVSEHGNSEHVNSVHVNSVRVLTIRRSNKHLNTILTDVIQNLQSLPINAHSINTLD